MASPYPQAPVLPAALLRLEEPRRGFRAHRNQALLKYTPKGASLVAQGLCSSH